VSALIKKNSLSCQFIEVSSSFNIAILIFPKPLRFPFDYNLAIIEKEFLQKMTSQDPQKKLKIAIVGGGLVSYCACLLM